MTQSKDSRETPRHILCIEGEGMSSFPGEWNLLGGLRAAFQYLQRGGSHEGWAKVCAQVQNETEDTKSNQKGSD